MSHAHSFLAQPERRSFKARGSFKSSKAKNAPSPLKHWKRIAFGGKLNPDNRLHYAQVNYSTTLLLPIQVYPCLIPFVFQSICLVRSMMSVYCLLLDTW